MSQDGGDRLEELEQRLDAAFAATRPRRGFEDELWARLQARRPLWRRLGRLGAAPWAGAGAVATLVVAGLVVLTLSIGSHRGNFSGSSAVGGGTTASAPERGTDTATSGQAAAPGLAPTNPNPTAGLAFGQLPTPAGAGVAPTGAVIRGASPPAEPPALPVYRFDPATGPADGTIVEANAIPAGLASAPYPTRPAADAIAGRTDLQSGQGSVPLTQARLVYVAVVSGGQGYLEPAYLYTGVTPGGGEARLLVPALAAAALR